VATGTLPVGSQAAQPSLRALARSLGCSHQAVQKAARRGRLDGAVGKDAMGRLIVLDAALAAQMWATHRTQASPGPTSASEKAPEAKKSSRGPTSLVDVQVRLGMAKAVAQELATRIRQGELIEVAKAKNSGFTFARVLRDNILNIPDRMAGELAGESDAARVHARLTAELHQVLEQTAGMLDG
jgi:phage terminase Nu1 subunit (DNA packaging protein)